MLYFSPLCVEIKTSQVLSIRLIRQLETTTTLSLFFCIYFFSYTISPNNTFLLSFHVVLVVSRLVVGIVVVVNGEVGDVLGRKNTCPPPTHKNKNNKNNKEWNEYFYQNCLYSLDSPQFLFLQKLQSKEKEIEKENEDERKKDSR